MSRTQIFAAVRPHGPSSRASLCSVNISAPGGGLRISTDPETKLMFGLREENFGQPNAAGNPDERARKNSPCGLLLPSPRRALLSSRGAVGGLHCRAWHRGCARSACGLSVFGGTRGRTDETGHGEGAEIWKADLTILRFSRCAMCELTVFTMRGCGAVCGFFVVAKNWRRAVASDVCVSTSFFQTLEPP